jgi:hypothetical protein
MQLLHDANRYRDRNKIRRIENGAGQIANIGQRRTSVNPLFRITQARIGHKVAIRLTQREDFDKIDNGVRVAS